MPLTDSSASVMVFMNIWSATSKYCLRKTILAKTLIVHIACKLKGAGCHHEIFEPQAIEAITNIGNGTPRMINNICNETLHVADHLKVDIVTANIVQKVLNEASFD